MMPWDELFQDSSGSNADEQLEMRVLRKQGRPLLLVPNNARAAARCLDLYPAQTGRARMAKTILRKLWQSGVFAKTQKHSLSLSRAGPLMRYLTSLVSPGAVLPQFGVLAGNPAGGTQRFIILLFGNQQEPRAVVKAGRTEAARELIKRERNFLSSVRAGVEGIPRILSQFTSDFLEAFATEFFPGDSPGSSDKHVLPALLTSWINREQKMNLNAFPELAAAAKGLGPNGATDFANDRQILTAIRHGDLAPWNIKVSRDGLWKVLDWERGRVAGIPAWDWFHYEIQTSVLVRKAQTEDLLKVVEQILSSPGFQGYAENAQIRGLERFLLKAYLWHLIEVIKPAEGLEQNRSLLNAIKHA